MRWTLLVSFLGALTVAETALAQADNAGLQPRHFTTASVPEGRHADTVRKARSAFVLSDGSEWALRPCPARDEPSCIAIARFSKDEVKPFIAADFLPGMPGGTIPIGKGGQIYSIASLDDGRKAVSLGWNDGKESHNAVVFLTFADEDRPTIDRVAELPGVRAIVGATHARVLAATVNAQIPGGGPRLTLLDGDGRIVKQWLDGDRPTAAEAVRAANGIRLQEVTPGRYAVFDPDDSSIRFLDLATGQFRSPVILNDDLSGQTIRDIYIAPNSSSAVVTTGKIDGRYRTAIHVYGADGNIIGRWTSDHPWQTVVHRGHVFTGTVVKDDVSTETVDLPGIE